LNIQDNREQEKPGSLKPGMEKKPKSLKSGTEKGGILWNLYGLCHNLKMVMPLNIISKTIQLGWLCL
jgi:hypothetical protein